jgi:ParB-like chromosome segregation protein Spo0J
MSTGDLRSWADRMPEDPSRYFTNPPGTRMFNLSELVATRARPEGIANAEKFMRRAYAGKTPRRAPIAVYPNGDGTYSVADGNSTLATARAHGWQRIPAIVQNPS